LKESFAAELAEPDLERPENKTVNHERFSFIETMFGGADAEGAA
jgi:hypothetical protein